ncbi:MAG: Mur ligase family protein [Oligoflexia bacterium]|nr:Mur ligase family protein [Oligoflexia bacterium]
MPASQLKLSQLKHVHVIGVCGTLMGAFAAFLKRSGLEVTGSDQNVYPPMSDVLSKAGVKLFNGYSAENLSRLGSKPDLVVIGNVIPATNPEARAAIDGGYVYSSLPEAMENLMLGETRNLVVAGTHGKTTTSSMLAHVLLKAGKDPSYFIGGVSLDLPFSFQVANTGKGGLFVLEGDEYDTAFWDKVPKFNHYLPNDLILTSVEYDHADIYPDLAAVMRAFEGLMIRIRPGGRLIACWDYANVREVVKKASLTPITYGGSRESGARFYADNVRQEGEWTCFDVCEGGRVLDGLKLRVPGAHNVMNAVAVWIECRELGLSQTQIREGLESFRGVKRRQEERGEVDGVLVIDDFAHHPTAVRETLRALRKKYSGRRLVAVFEPRSATSRRKIFQKEYSQAFAESDATFISAPYDQTKIKPEDQFSSDQLVDDLKASGHGAELMPSVEDGVRRLTDFARKGDLIAVLSNGGFGGFIPKLLESLKARSA